MAIVTLWGYGRDGYEYSGGYHYDRNLEGNVIFTRTSAFDRIFNEKDSIREAMAFYELDESKYRIDEEKRDDGYNIYEKDTGKEYMFAEIRYGSAAPCLEPFRRKEIDKILERYRNSISASALVIDGEKGKERGVRLCLDSNRTKQQSQRKSWPE